MLAELDVHALRNPAVGIRSDGLHYRVVDPEGAPIFVVGTGRSGTTLLQLMLCAHPRIFVAFESSFYLWQKMYPRRAPRRTFLEYYFHTPSFRWLGVDPERVLAALPDPLPPARTGEAFAAIMREKAAQHGRVRFGDKTPLHSAYLAQIFADFPDARVVHITRDPRATALSLSVSPWFPPTVYAGAFFCEFDRRWVEKYKDRILQIRFEDLLAEPRATMARVLEYVGEPWDDAVLDHSLHVPANVLPPYPWVQSAAHERRDVEPAWRRLDGLQIRMIELITRRIMREFEYAPAPLESEPGKVAIYREALRQLGRTLRPLQLLWRTMRIQRDPRSFYDDRAELIYREVNPSAWARWPGYSLTEPPALRPLPTGTPQASGDLAPTALYTSGTWSWGRLPGAELLASPEAKAVFAVTNGALALTRPFARRPVLRAGLVQRHLMIDRLLADSGAQHVLELAAGLSPRGVNVSVNPDVVYTEVDRAPVLAHKRRLLGRTPAGRAALARHNLHLRAAELGDAPLDRFSTGAAPFVIAEGLFMYLEAPAQRALWRRVRALAPAIFVFDLVPSAEQDNGGSRGRALGWLMKQATAGAGFTSDARSRADIAAELDDIGFQVEVLEPSDLPGLPHRDVKTQMVVFVCRSR